MKRVARSGAVAAFAGYLALGLASWPGGGPRAALPMADWSVPRIEAESVRALHVSGAARTPTPQTPTPQTSTPRRALPDLRTLEPYDIYTVGTRAGGDLRLKFATTIYNAGRGPLETRGAVNPRTEQLEVFQYVYEGDRATKGRSVGTFNYNHRHGHLHFDEFARYELWSVDADDRLLARVAQNRKVGFCLMDIKNMASEATHLASGLIGEAGGPVYAGCRDDIQGISPGWGDEYLALLYEQDLDLTGVPGGRYALRILSNPDREIEEARYDNNAAVAYLTLEDETVVWSSEVTDGG